MVSAPVDFWHLPIYESVSGFSNKVLTTLLITDSAEKTQSVALLQFSSHCDVR